ncbi:hypothetical protein N7481_011506 [Penicillium waksmanii]|uniref:uncharacterized protein n=1 Tax=Penicillium waksmanii TaxID=69791 RepID=UPI002548740E|nr:uncharacterized protein N7481_011506 [Penicillium waksmanii]KAJ5974296.1 hypothetical protein N7481_011506 [Penicillium waksmanii]
MNSRLKELLANGEEVTDAEEAKISPPGNLGFLEPRAPTVDVTIRGAEYTVHQSPTLLSSSRAGGTTGAVLWKITPFFADWISSASNPLWTHSFLSSDSVVAELGCGISALVALALAPSVNHYLATDQEYVRRLFRTNLEENASVNSTTLSTKQKATKSRGAKPAKKQSSSANNEPRNVTFTTLDWELDQPELLKGCIGTDSGGHEAETDTEEDNGFDLILSCDCIYNDALVTPFVRTCAEICRLRPAYEPSDESESPSPSTRQPTICIVAQQQRAPDVFEAWLRETLREFRVWRLSDDVLVEGLKNGSGYLVHLLLAR